MTYIIPKHLLQSQALPQQHISRSRIIHEFQDHAASKLLVVEAPAGYGKSVTVAEYVLSQSSLVAWYPLEYLRDVNPISFAMNLLRAVQAVATEFGQPLAKIIQRQENIEQGRYEKQWLTTTFVPALNQALGELDQELFIVFDNYHCISDKEIDEAVVDLVEQSPTHVHFIITSRQQMVWSNRARWQAEGKFISITEEQLAFTKAESQQLAVNYRVSLIGVVAEQIHLETNGWPILYAILFQNCQDKGPEQIEKTLHILTRPQQQIYEYLIAELLEREDQIVQEFLCQTSVLRELDPGLCELLVEMSNSRSLLNYLCKTMFVNVIESVDGTTYVHSHEIVRDCLQRALEQQYGLAKKNELYARLGRLLEQQGNWDQAILHYCQGEQYEQACHLIIRHAPHLIDASAETQLDSWLSHIPISWVNKNPKLLMYQGIIAAGQRSPTAKDFLVEAQQLFAAHGDHVGTIEAQISLGWVLFISGDLTEAITVLDRARQAEDIPAGLQARILHYLAIANQGLDRFEDAFRYGSEAVKVYRRLGTFSEKGALVRLLRHLGMAHRAHGSFQTALTHLQEAHAYAHALNQGEWAIAWIDNQLAEVARHLGEMDEGHRYLNEADELLDPYRQLGSRSRLLSFLLITRGHLYRETYDFARAEALYKQAGRSGHMTDGVFLALRLAQPGYEQEALERALAKWREERSGSSPVTVALYQGMLGIAYMKTDNFEQAQIQLEEACKVLEAHGAIFALVSYQLYLAKVYQMTGKSIRSNQSLRVGLSAMAEHGYYGLEVWQPWVMADLCAQAIREEIEPEYVEQLATKRLRAEHATAFFPLLRESNPAVNSRSIRLLQQLGAATTVRAYELIATCREPSTQARLTGWLISGWITDVGLIRLRQLLNGCRQLEVFLLWIQPSLQGSTDAIADMLILGKHSIGKYLKEIKLVFEDELGVVFENRGAHSVAYQWAIQEGIVNPRVSSVDMSTTEQ